MAFTQTDLDVIEAAIAKGEQTVQFADRTVTYRSVDQLLKARAEIVAALTTRKRQVLGVSNKGFGC